MKAHLQDHGKWYFLGIMILSYIVFNFFDSEKISRASQQTLKIFVNIAPIFLVVIILMVITGLMLNTQFILKHMKSSSGIKAWAFAIIGGMLSTGPIFLWLPLLSQLQEKGVENKFLITFLYNRAIKLPLLPILASYFGITYTIVLTIIMIITSIVQGIIIGNILEVKHA